MITVIIGFIFLNFSFLTAVAQPMGKKIGSVYLEDESGVSINETNIIGLMTQKLGVRFDEFLVSRSYSGHSIMPDFRGRDKNFSHYRTRIREMMRRPPNFGGKYSFIKIGCGSGCSTLYVGDHSTGRVYRFPRGAEDNLVISVYGQSNSNLIIINWQDSGAYSEDVGCFWESFEWKNNKAKLLRKINIKERELC